LNLTDYLAIYGAFVSTVVFMWNIYRTRARIRVEVVPGFHGNGDEKKFGVYISIKNVSAHTVHLSNVSVLYPYQNPSMRERLNHIVRFRSLPYTVGWVHSSLSNYKLKDGCPVSLDARKSHEIFVPNAAFRKILEDAVRREIKAVVQDQLWKNIYSRSLKVDWNIDD
jgi:hypothetical protein